jgi:hypothetical protein
MAKYICVHLFVEHPIPKSWALIWSCPFVTKTASTLLGRLSTRCWNIAVRSCFHSATRALVRSDTDVGRLGLAHSRHSNSSQRCSMGLRSGFCAGQFFHTDIDKPFLYGQGKGLPQTVATKLESQNRLEGHCMLYC